MCVFRSNYVVYGLVAATALLASFAQYDPDFGWHLRSREQIVQQGAPTIEPYTYTASDFPWVHHEWLADGLHYLIYDMVGFAGLAIVHAALWTFGLWCFARKYRQQWPVLLALFVMLPFVGVRAISWMVALLGVMYLLVSGRRWMRWLLPGLFALWANLHGSFLVGIVYLAYRALRRRDMWLGVIAGLSLAATLLMPYGIHLYDEVGRTVLDADLSNRISEWASWMLHPIMAPFVALWGAGLWRLYQSRRSWLVFVRFDVLMALAMVSSWRHAVLFALFALPLALRTVDTLPRPVIKAQDRQFAAFSIAAVAVAAVVLVATSLSGYVSRLIAADRAVDYPTRIVESLRRTPCDGRIFNHYDVGGYLIWTLPDEKVYIDDRMPSWQHDGQHYFETYLDVLDDASVREREFTKHDIGCVLMPEGRRIVSELIDKGWYVTLREENNDYVLLETVERTR